MATYQVLKRDNNNWYIIGLHSRFGPAPDSCIFPGLNYALNTPESLTAGVYEALYDEFQMHPGLKVGDIFDTPVGQFICEGVHVLPHDKKANDMLAAAETIERF